MAKMNRRSILKSIGISATSVPIISRDTNAKRRGPRPKILKGNPSNPVRKNQVSRVREAVLEELAKSEEAPSEVAVTGNPEPTNGQLVGYGIAIQNGVPIERIKTIDDPSGDENPHRQRNRRSAQGASLPDQAAATSIQDRVEAAHGDLDRFRQRFKGDE